MKEDESEDSNAHPPDRSGETETRPADFSPDPMHMYVCFQKNGVVFDITRRDGKSVGGRSIDVKFHNLAERMSARVGLDGARGRYLQ